MLVNIGGVDVDVLMGFFFSFSRIILGFSMPYPWRSHPQKHCGREAWAWTGAGNPCARGAAGTGGF